MTRITRFPVERRRSAPVPLVPLAPQRGRIPDDIDHLLSDLARSEEADSPVIRNALATAYSPILLRIDRKVWWAVARHDLIDLDDVTHEGFLVFCDLLQRWSGDGSFSRFLLGRYQWRVRERVVRLNGRAPSADVAVSLALSAHDSWEAEQALSLLHELVAPLSDFDRALVIARVVDRRSMREIATRLGVSPSTAEARWSALRHDLYRNLQLLLHNYF